MDGAGTMTPSIEQIRQWEAVAKGKQQVLRVLADALLVCESASSGYLRQRCGLSADEWHGAGELLASVICFAADKNFIEWHAAGMADIDIPDQLEAARAEGYRAGLEAEREKSRKAVDAACAAMADDLKARGYRKGLEEAAATRPSRQAGNPPGNNWSGRDGGHYASGWNDGVWAYLAAIRAKLAEGESDGE